MRINTKHVYPVHLSGGLAHASSPSPHQQTSAAAMPAACGRSFLNATDGSFPLRIVNIDLDSANLSHAPIPFSSDPERSPGNIWPVNPNPELRAYKRRLVDCNHNPFNLLTSPSYPPPL